MNNKKGQTEMHSHSAGKLPGNNRITSFLVAFFFVVVSLSIYSCKSNNKPAEQNQAQHTDTAAAARDSIQSQVNAARVQIDDLTSKSAELDSQIHAKDAEIEKLQKEQKKLGGRNRSLAAKLRKDKKTIKSLKGQLSEKDKEYADRLGILQSDKDNLSKQLSDMMQKYNDLKKLGSVLHASNMKLEPLHTKRSGREKVTRRARKLNILRVHFDIDENRIAEDGNKKLYLVIKGPDGKLLSNAGNSSGTLTDYKGNTVSYSILKEIYLKQNEAVNDVTVDWNQEGDHEKGIYNITIYNGGYKIGAGSVTLK